MFAACFDSIARGIPDWQPAAVGTGGTAAKASAGGLELLRAEVDRRALGRRRTATDLGLKFGGTRRFAHINARTFTRLEERLQVRGAQLADIVEETVDKTRAEWPQCAALLDGNQTLQDAVRKSIETHSRTLRRSP